MTKIIALVLFILINSSLHKTLPQENESSSTGPIPKLRKERIHTNVNLSQNPAIIGYGYSSIQNLTLSMPIPAGTPFTLLAPWTEPVFASSMIKGPNGVYYLTEVGPPAALCLFDPGTGTVTMVGSITGMGADQPNGISYNPADGIYYIASSTDLFSFDVGTYIASLIGPFNTGGLMIDLCFDDAGICYGYDIELDKAYTIDLATGNATLLGPLGYAANYGQGMSYDFETGTIYLSAFNNTTNTGQLRTMNPTTGNTTLIVDWGFDQVAPFALNTNYGPPCPVGAPSNPNPPNGATSVPITGNTATWTNGAETTQIELWFGSTGSLTQVYSGTPITSYALPTLNYETTYAWYVIDKNDTCGTLGPVWSFITDCDPIYVFEEFNNLNCWTPIGPLGLTNWEIYSTNNAGGTAPELRLSWTPAFNGLSQLLSSPFTNPLPPGFEINLQMRHFCDWYADPAPFIGIGITYDNGATVTPIWEMQPIGGNVGPEILWLDFTPTVNDYQLVLYLNGNSFNIDYWYIDEIMLLYLPVELTSFTFEIDENVVTLFWQTATETNNLGFEIERFQDSKNEEMPGWERIGFVEGKGTTTEPQSYSFTDKAELGKYKYRLKQLDFDGHYEYSKEIEAEVLASLEFSLVQNYPNPFNPTTKIKFSIPKPSKVEMRIFDILGNVIETLVYKEMQAGRYEVEFNATAIPSGVYFYQLRAGSFVDMKKMILVK